MESFVCLLLCALLYNKITFFYTNRSMLQTYCHGVDSFIESS